MTKSKKPTKTKTAEVGLTCLGKLADGKKWWVARITWVDPKTGRKRSTRAKYAADSLYLAALERKRRTEEKRATGGAVKTRHRFREAFELYFATVTTHASKQARTAHGKRVNAHFGDWFVDAIETTHIQDHLDALDLGASMKRSLRTTMSLSFQEAIKKRWTATNPTRGVTVSDKLRKGQQRTVAPKRSLSAAEAAAYAADVRAHEPPEMALFLLTSMRMGVRFAEASALTWDAIDFDTGVVTLAVGQYGGVSGETKSKYIRQSVLDRGALSELQEHRKSMAEFRWPGWETLVFPRPMSARKRPNNYFAYHTANTVVKRSFKRLGLDNMKVATHVARHTHLNLARQGGDVDPLMLRKMMGHATLEQQLTYTGIELVEARAIASKVSRVLQGVTTDVTVTKSLEKPDTIPEG